jgi:hypothetical protein
MPSVRSPTIYQVNTRAMYNIMIRDRMLNVKDLTSFL